MNEEEQNAGMAATPGYRYADVVDNRLFVAGQVPHDADGNIVGLDDPGAQATRCLDNLKTLIEVHGFGIEDIRRLTIYVVGEQQNLTDAWAATRDWFDTSVPPATLLGVNLLGHMGQLVEVDATIVKKALLVLRSEDSERSDAAAQQYQQRHY